MTLALCVTCEGDGRDSTAPDAGPCRVCGGAGTIADPPPAAPPPDPTHAWRLRDSLTGAIELYLTEADARAARRRHGSGGRQITRWVVERLDGDAWVPAGPGAPGRPPGAEKAAPTVKVMCLTPDERIKVQTRARRAGLTVSAWVAGLIRREIGQP